MNEKREQLQIYKEKLSELCQQNEDLLAKNQKLQTENDTLRSQSRDLNVQYKTPLEGSGPPDSNLPVPTNQKGREVSLPLPRKAAKRRILFPLTALLAFAAIIAAVGFYTRMNLFEDSYHREHASLEQTKNDLSETKNALEEVQKALAETQGTLTEREDTLTQLYGGLAEACEENFGYFSSAFRMDQTYANSGIVILAVGQTKTLEAYNNYLTMYATASDEEAISVEVQNSRGRSPKVNITAQRPGIYTVTCKADYAKYFMGAVRRFEASFNILVIVPEEGMLPEISDVEEGTLSETLGAGGGTT